MNIVKLENEDLSLLLKVTVSEQDYAPAVEKALREYRRKANIPGFRPGMVPMAIIKKMYGKGVTAEQAYRTATDKCFEYVEQQGIDFIGDIIPSQEQPPLDFDANTEHEFDFELGLAPKVDMTLDQSDKLTWYKIKPGKDMTEGYRSNFLRRFGRLVDVESVQKDEALTVTLENGSMRVEDAYVGLISMSEAKREMFIGRKVGDKLSVDVNELYENPAQRAAILQVKQDELEGIDPKFEMTIDKIRRFAEPELDEEFFKQAFPGGEVSDAAGFDKYIDERIAADMARESDRLLAVQFKEYLIGKAALRLPEEFLKRWLFTINEGKFSMEEIEKDFAGFLKMMAWNLIQKHYMDELKIEVTPDDAMQMAREMTRMQFAQYGMEAVPDETLDGYARNIMANKQEASRIYDSVREDKVIAALKKMVKISTKSVSVEEFGKIAQSLS